MSERLLNAESGFRTLWGNLGYWDRDSTYPEACEALAHYLAASVDLSSDDSVVDIGFGCGDQILLWLKHYHLKRLGGINLSASQTTYAKQRLIDQGFSQTANQLHTGCIRDLEYDIRRQVKTASVILALDCAYHFPDRAQILRSLAELSPAHCRFAFTDLLLARKPDFFERQILKLMMSLSQIPHENLMQNEAYREHLTKAGWLHLKSTDLTDKVFIPFSDWLIKYRQERIRHGTKAKWRKYLGTSWFVRWAKKRNLLEYRCWVLTK